MCEIGLVWFPDYLPEALDGFGVQASYTRLSSQQTTPDTNSEGEITGYRDTDLFGVSDSSYSVVLAYDKNDLGMRLSYSWREGFLANYEAALFANPLEMRRKSEASMDFQLSYKLTEQFEITLDGTNLTNDMGQTPLNIVLKLVECNRQSVAKISDSPGKTMTDNDTFLAYLRQVFDIQE